MSTTFCTLSFGKLLIYPSSIFGRHTGRPERIAHRVALDGDASRATTSGHLGRRMVAAMASRNHLQGQRSSVGTGAITRHIWRANNSKNVERRHHHQQQTTTVDGSSRRGTRGDAWPLSCCHLNGDSLAFSLLCFRVAGDWTLGPRRGPICLGQRSQ